MKILVHTCCANCLIYPMEIMRGKELEIHSFFYNHIHPFMEMLKRLESLAFLTEKENINLIIREEYNLEKFIRNTVYREENRCDFCYFSRLEATVKLAAKSGFNLFTTTLLYSKHQKHELIKNICKSLSKKYSVEFFYYDFREGWQQGIEKSKSLGLYRQNYCGCIFSEKERYLGKRDRFDFNKIIAENR